MIGELDQVVLTRPVRGLGLKAGEIGTVVLVHGAGEGFEVEFVAPDGNTRVVTTLIRDDVRPAASPSR